MEHLTFLTTAMKDRNVGAVAPTSPTSVKYVCRRIDRTRPAVVVEYGPGTGAFTRYLLKNLHPESTLIGIEMNREFARKLRSYRKRKQIRNPQFIVAHDNACNVEKILQKHGFARADYIISGIPFSFIDEPTKKQIVASTRKALADDGKFLVYQYSFAMKSTLEQYFADVRKGRWLLNLPPICALEASGYSAAFRSTASTEFLGQSLQSSVAVDASQR
jgi:phospholipid N-methyltransferase